MRVRYFFWVAGTLLLADWAGSAHAAPIIPGTPNGVGANTFVVVIEEDTLGSPNGFLNGKISMNGGAFTQLPDLLVGGVPAVTLPYAVVGGDVDRDVVLMEPPDPLNPPDPNNVSDLLRFHGNPAGGDQTFLCFFSAAAPSEMTGFKEIIPPAPVNQLNLIEAGPEGTNGAIYVSGNATYIIISDVVPEPASIVSWAIGLALFGTWGLLRAGRRGEAQGGNKGAGI
jgi:hypothetical protein